MAETQLEKLAKSDFKAWIARGVIVFILLSMAAYFWLFADRHNDGRYISIDSYTKDTIQQSRLTVELAARLVELRVIRDKDHDLVVEMSNDIKWIKENLARKL